MSQPVILGRNSSHFTRATRIFALELGVPHTFQAGLDMMSLDPATFGGNPALKIPVLVDEQGPLFGMENVCRDLCRRSGKRQSVVMRGDVPGRVVANVEELTLHVMFTDVSLVMAKLTGAGRPPKVQESLEGSLRWLDANVDTTLAALPEGRALSFVEVGLFSAVTHLAFRELADVTPWSRLAAFCARFGERESARATAYRFDAA